MVVLRPLVAWLLIATALAGCAGSAPDAVQAPEAVAGPVPAGNYTFDSFARVVTPGDLVALPFVKTFLSSQQDGVDIEVGFWRPDTDEPVPILVDAGPYYGNDGAPMQNGAGHLNRLITNFLPHGYAVAAISVRGTGDSGGCMDLMGAVEVADLDQAITWLALQEWSSGNVAMLGKSYDGSTPWQVASTGNPHLKTIVPMSGVPDLYDLMFRNGTSEIRGPLVLNGLYYSYGVLAPQMLPGTPDEAARAVVQGVEGTACPDHGQGLLSSVTAGAGMGRDAWWAERNLKPGVEANYNGSVLMVQGLQDWNVDPGMSLPWADELERSGLLVHQMLGQWGHSYPDVVGNTQSANHRWDWAEILLQWFDHFLKGKDIDLGPKVQVLDSEHRWRADHSFPPRDATLARYNLSVGGALTLDEAEAGSIQLLPQAMAPGLVPTEPPAGASADFVLPVQEAELLVSGLPKVHVTVTPQGNAGGLAAWLYSVHPDGTEERLGWAMMNLRFHDGGEQPRDLTPGQSVLAKMEIQPMDGAVLQGEQLMLRIWQYRDDPPNDQVQGRLPSVPMPVTLELGGDQSTLVLPIIERGEGSYFQPPRP